VKKFFAGALLALICMGDGTLLAQGPAPFRVEFENYALLAGGAPVGEERTVVPGDEVLRTGVGYAAAARLAAPLSLTVAGLHLDLTADDLLLEGTPRGDTRDRLGAHARIFCGPPLQSLPNPPHAERRYQDLSYVCLVDGNGDRMIEAAFLVGARQPADIAITSVPATRYVEMNNIPLPRSSAWITFERGAALQGPVLEFHVAMFGRPAFIRGANIVVDGRRRFFPIERGVRHDVYPHVIDFGSAQVSILDYVPEGRHLRLRVDRAFETAPMQLQAMGPNIIFIYH
jgi:hypothetical protein